MPMLFNDIFEDNAFGFASLTAGIQQLEYVESRLGQLGLFSGFTEGVETDSVVIDETEGQIEILTSRPREAPPQKPAKEKAAKSRAIRIPHFEFEDRLMAASIMGKRQPGENQLQSVARKVNDRYTYMLSNMYAPTMEVHRLNALRGILLDSDGSVIHDYFDFFGVTQETHDFVFSVATTKIRTVCTAAWRKVEDILNGVPFTGLRAICGRDFFDALIDHPTVRDTYIYQQGQQLQKSQRTLVFGDIQWEEYRGMRGLDDNLGQVDDDEAILFPEGVPGMYRTYYAPGSFMETVNQLGQPLYAKVAPDWKYNKWVDQLIETNPLHINCRPKAVLRVTKS